MPDTAENMISEVEQWARARFGPLSEAEHQLLRAAQAGVGMGYPFNTDGSGMAELDIAQAEEWNDSRTIRATLLRWLCVDGRAKERIDPHGINIFFAKLSGRLDLSYLSLPFPLVCDSCWLPDGLELSMTTLPRLSLQGSWLGPASPVFGNGEACRPVIEATGALVKGSILLRNGFRAKGEVRLLGARIEGDLECDGSLLSNAGGAALNAEGGKISGSALLRNGCVAEGELRLYRAEIGGNLECSAGCFRNEGSATIGGVLARVGGAVHLCDGFVSEGEVQLYGAEIGGILTCNAGNFKNPRGIALGLDRARIAAAISFREGFSADGEVSLFGIDIGGSLYCDTGCINNGGEVALHAERARVGGGIFLRHGFSAEGEVRLAGVRVGGNLDGNGGKFNNPGQTALNGEGAIITGGVFLRTGFAADGEVRLVGAEIGGNLECDGSRFSNPHKPALDVGRARIGGNVLLRNACTVEGDLLLVDTKIGSDLDLSQADFGSGTGARLEATRAEITGALIVQGLKQGAVTEINLADSSCSVLTDVPEDWPDGGRLNLDGFTYRRISDPATAERRLGWLRGQLPRNADGAPASFSTQPYQRLAEVLRAQGSEAEARQILMAMAQDRVALSELGPFGRAWRRILWATIRDGHQPFRVTLWLGTLWLAGFFLFGWGYQAGVMVPSDRAAYEEFAKSNAGAPIATGHYEPFCAPVYAIDLMMPLPSVGQRDHWRPIGWGADFAPISPPYSNSSISAAFCQARFGGSGDNNWTPSTAKNLGAALGLYRWIHIGLGWFLVALFIAAIAGLVPRE